MIVTTRKITMQEFLTLHKQELAMYAAQNKYTIERALQIMLNGGILPKRTQGQGGAHEVDIVRKPKPEVIAITSGGGGNDEEI